MYVHRFFINQKSISIPHLNKIFTCNVFNVPIFVFYLHIFGCNFIHK